MELAGGAVLVVLLVLLSGLRIPREYQRAVVFRLGRYTGLRGPGLFWLIPLGIENETELTSGSSLLQSSSRKPSRATA
jgi:regulator of protease activity HflC (stomatin/prohibitin superfamily)